MKLTGSFTVDALYYAELAGPDWEDYISLSQVNDQSGSQRENQSPLFLSWLNILPVENQHKY